jgi:hypothetical protein
VRQISEIRFPCSDFLFPVSCSLFGFCATWFFCAHLFSAVPFCLIFVFILPLRICLVRDRSVLRDFPIPTSGSQCYRFLRRTILLLDWCSRRLVAFFLPERAKVAPVQRFLLPPPFFVWCCARSGIRTPSVLI